MQTFIFILTEHFVLLVGFENLHGCSIRYVNNVLHVLMAQPVAAETHLVALTKTESVVSVQIDDESKPKASCGCEQFKKTKTEKHVSLEMK